MSAVFEQVARSNSFKSKRPQPQKQKPKRWSHQDALDASIGKQIEIGITGLGVLKGVLLSADQWSIRLLLTHMADTELPEKSRVDMTYFKHAISCFQIPG